MSYELRDNKNQEAGFYGFVRGIVMVYVGEQRTER